MTSWELGLYFGARYGIPLEITVSIDKKTDEQKLKSYYLRQFNMAKGDIVWHFISQDNCLGDETIETARDRILINSADTIYPISIRPKGNLDQLLEANWKKIAVNEKYRVPYNVPKKSYKYLIDEDRINPEIDFSLDNYLIHWTRTFNKPWPGELLYEYYDSIVSSDTNYSHTAINSLKRMFGQKIIYVSNRHYQKDFPAVGFSSLKPSEAAALMCWRARYREMSFEPYGIAIKKEYALSMGIKEVIYGTPNTMEKLATDMKPYFQSMGKRGNWVPEKEFRYIGNFDLEQIDERDLIAIVWKKDEISEIKNVFRGEIISFYD
jgi:hypothetical protein